MRGATAGYEPMIQTRGGVSCHSFLSRLRRPEQSCLRVLSPLSTVVVAEQMAPHERSGALLANLVELHVPLLLLAQLRQLLVGEKSACARAFARALRSAHSAQAWRNVGAALAPPRPAGIEDVARRCVQMLKTKQILGANSTEDRAARRGSVARAARRALPRCTRTRWGAGCFSVRPRRTRA